MERLELVHIIERSRAIGKETLADELVGAAIGQARKLVQVVFGVVLHCPERAAVVCDGDRLHGREGIRGQQHRSARQASDFVLMTDEGVEHNRLAGKKRVFLAFGRQCDLAGNAHFPTTRMRGHAAPGSDHRDLCRPAASKAGHPRGERRLGELDLRRHPCVVGVDRQARTGPGNAVIVRKRGTSRQRYPGIGRINDVDFARRQDLLKHLRIKLAGGRRPTGT